MPTLRQSRLEGVRSARGRTLFLADSMKYLHPGPLNRAYVKAFKKLI